MVFDCRFRPRRIVAAAAVAWLLSFSAQPAVAQSAVDAFNADARTLSNTLTTFLKAIGDLDGRLVYVQGKLDLPGQISSDLKQLDSALTNAKTLLDAASLVPDIKDPVDTLVSGINATQQPVRDAQVNADGFDNAIKPAQVSVNSVEGTVHKLGTDIQNFQQALSTYVQQVDAAQQCVGRMQDKTAQAALDKLATTSDPKIRQINTALQTILSNVNTIQQNIANQLYPLFGPINDVETDVATVNTNLQNMEGPLKDVGNIISKKFSVSFPYWHPTWSHPWRVSHYTISISMSTIIGGAEKIEAEIEHILSSALYKAAKLFGLDKLINSLVADANKGMNEVVAKLHLDFKVSIPGLGGFGGALNDISSKLTSLLPSMGIETGSLDTQIASIQGDFSSVPRFSACGSPAAQPQPRIPQVPPSTYPYPHGPLGPLGPGGFHPGPYAPDTGPGGFGGL